MIRPMSQGDANPPTDPKAAAPTEDPMPGRHVVFSHGKESGPWGKKISSLAEVARSEGYEAHSVDYRGLDDPRQRVAKLVEFCKELSGDLVLVGSSLGGYVAVASASLLHARGVFLMAPALYMPGLPEPRPGALDCPATVVHGWRDDVVPFEHSVRFAQATRAALHLLESDHNLHNQIRVIQYLFEYFLIALDLPALAFE
jgi:pimeloyl-ACP methyl ester carboxylesterase